MFSFRHQKHSKIRQRSFEIRRIDGHYGPFRRWKIHTTQHTHGIQVNEFFIFQYTFKRICQFYILDRLNYWLCWLCYSSFLTYIFFNALYIYLYTHWPLFRNRHPSINCFIKYIFIGHPFSVLPYNILFFPRVYFTLQTSTCSSSKYATGQVQCI